MNARLLCAASALLLLATPATAAPALSKAQITERARVLLSGFEFVPTADAWDALGPAGAVADVLMTLTKDQTGLVRYRAMSSLAHFPTPGVKTFLVSNAQQTSLAPRLRAKALRALGAGFKEQALTALTPMLSEADPVIREAAVKAMQPMAAAAVQTLLEDRMSGEPVAWVRATMGRVAERVADNRAELLRRKLPVPDIAPILAPPPVRVTPKGR